MRQKPLKIYCNDGMCPVTREGIKHIHSKPVISEYPIRNLYYHKLSRLADKQARWTLFQICLFYTPISTYMWLVVGLTPFQMVLWFLGSALAFAIPLGIICRQLMLMDRIKRWLKL